MTEKNGHVRWPSFITMGLTLAGMMVTLAVWGATQVIANDRIRAAEDTRIETKVMEKIESILRDNSLEHRQIMGDLREIKAKMGISEHGVRMS